MKPPRLIRRETVPLQHLFLRLTESEGGGRQWAIVAANVAGGVPSAPGDIIASGFLDQPEKFATELRAAADTIEALARVRLTAAEARRLTDPDASVADLCRPLSATVMSSRPDWSEGKAQSDRGRLQAQRKNTGPKSRRSAAKGGSRP